MRTRIPEVPASAVAGGLAVIGGAALWQLGIEFERAWLRSYDGPLLGDTVDTPADDRAEMPLRGDSGGSPERRRWVAGHHPRALSRAAHTA
ncbi:MAG TPA: hypothetical protein VK778_08550 [Solirubrobacteraceae bacterium]|jgi:hypothetical protein|nr:hypothetical protein [Solirubrobacteraceae bacterium]